MLVDKMQWQKKLLQIVKRLSFFVILASECLCLSVCLPEQLSPLFGLRMLFFLEILRTTRSLVLKKVIEPNFQNPRPPLPNLGHFYPNIVKKRPNCPRIGHCYPKSGPKACTYCSQLFELKILYVLIWESVLKIFLDFCWMMRYYSM